MPPHWITQPCPAPSQLHLARAEGRQAVLTKPPGSLGTLERIAITLAGLQGRDDPQADRAPIVLFAGDHGVTAQGISAFPCEVTVQMLANFSAGGAAISVLARQLGVPLMLVDAGSAAAEVPPGVVVDKPRRGTADFSQGAAMTADDLGHALGAGQRAVAAAAKDGADLILFGEMGIGNTTAAAAIAAALLGRPATEIVGAGTGLNAAGIAHKAAVITVALGKHGLGADSDPMAVLQTVGGLEIAALSGAIIAAAQARVPVLVDGFIVTAAALAAVRLNPGCRPWLIFSHRSAERGHQTVLDALDAWTVLDLGLRLGEGSGAATALSVVRLACSLHNEMATFGEAHVSEKSS